MPKKIEFVPLNSLRALRLARGESLAVVAKACNTSTAQIQKLETGERDLDYHWMVRIARYYGVAPADLLLPKDGGLSPQERRVVDTMREIPDAGREMLLAGVESQQPYRQTPEIIPIEELRAAS